MDNYNQFFSTVAKYAKDKLENAPGCHDWEHTMRVLSNARTILCKIPDADSEVVEIATLLHDISRPEEMISKGEFCHAIKGAQVAKKYLTSLRCMQIFIDKVTSCIKAHRFRSSGYIPQTIEEKILYDADKLDSIGAIGIARAFHFAGRERAKVHNTKEEALNSTSYSLDDTAYREYLVKLSKIKDKLFTASAKRIAEERTSFMENFFKELNKETSLILNFEF